MIARTSDFLLLRRHEQSRFALDHGFRSPHHPRGDDRALCEGGFDQHPPEAFPPGRENEDVKIVDKPACVLSPAHPRHTLADPQISREFLELRCVLAVPPMMTPRT